MKVLVTGSAGFVGQKLVESLEQRGHTVVPFDIVTGQDILNYDEVLKTVQSVEAVFHIAALADLTKITDPHTGKLCNDLNVIGTYNVAHACAVHKKWLIYASTCCVYGNSHDPSLVEDEDHALPHPNELYAASKLAGENMIVGYGRSFDLPYTILRYGTIYGPGMRGALAVAVFFDQAYQGKDITIHGTGKQERTQTYIDDIVEGTVRVLEYTASQGQVINITALERISVNRMAEDIVKLTNSPSKIVHGPDRKNQTLYEHFDNRKAIQFLEWQPKTSWDEGVRLTGEWIAKDRDYKAFS
jgi:nucleoside-diphosphate-sugar epimerase